jgi:hypothetical protein
VKRNDCGVTETIIIVEISGVQDITSRKFVMFLPLVSTFLGLPLI